MKQTIEALIESTQKYGLPLTLSAVFGKNIKIRVGFSQEACERGIDELLLRTRSHNALRRENIQTVGALVEAINAGDLRRIRNLGTISYHEIQTKLLVFAYDNLSEQSKRAFFEKLLELN